tara:strand:- start:844 stop:1788 length:945 start_codon:yes stop_codon:yes gene_type:complete
MKKKAVIVSIKGPKLSKKEKLLLSKEKPWGIILFKRNIISCNQIKKLVIDIKKLTKDKNFPIMIDEEGSTVSRLSSILNHNTNANYFGDLYKVDKELAKNLYSTYIDSLCKILNKIGINVNTIPVLDVLRKNTNRIIGKRSFSKNKKTVRELGNVTIGKCHQNNIISVIKHIPGHGCSSVDSHLSMPKVNLRKELLEKSDFYPFIKSKAKIAMTAHILYSKIDPENVATFSSTIIQKIIRKKLSFKGIIISDDISMKALNYDLVTNAKKSLEAGCNLVLYCAGNIKDNFKLIKNVPFIDKFTSKKTSEIYKILR